MKWYDPDRFDLNDWMKYEEVEQGDMNWLIPGKLLAFATPYDVKVLPGGWKVATPRDLVPVFRTKGITTIVRLCQKFYNEDIFVRAGFTHVELYFLDGSVPPTQVRDQFLRLIEGREIIALHCKAGLGRTFVCFSNSQRNSCRVPYD
jgi:cell division cycle 14